MSITVELQLLEKDPDRPWVVVRDTRETLEAASRQTFWSEALRRWPPDRFTVVPDPGSGV